MKKIKYKTFDDHNSVSIKGFSSVQPIIYYIYFIGVVDRTTLLSFNLLWQTRSGLIDKYYENLMPPGFTQAVKFVKTTSRLFRRMKQWIKQNLSK